MMSEITILVDLYRNTSNTFVYVVQLDACSNSRINDVTRKILPPPPAGDHRFHQLHQLVVKWMQAGLYFPNDPPTTCVFLAEDIRRVLSRVLHRCVL